MILDDNSKSLEQSLFMFNKFTECAGLRVNLDKTEAIWLGSRQSCHEQLLPDKHLSWNFSGKFKLLGISFNLSESDKTLENFTEKVLPNPPDSILNDIEKIFYTFLCNGKKDKIKRSVIIILPSCYIYLLTP